MERFLTNSWYMAARIHELGERCSVVACWGQDYA